jgi:hypothetical protein
MIVAPNFSPNSNPMGNPMGSSGGGKGGGVNVGTDVSQNSGMPQSMVNAGGPNVYQQAAGGVTGGMAGTAREMGYNPMQVQAGMGNAAMVGQQGPLSADQVRAGQIASTDLSAYFNPYENQVVQNTLSDINMAGLAQQNELEAQASRSGAFGGSRHGVALSGLGSELTRQSGQAAAALRQAGFQNAQQMAQQDIAGRMQADLANQGANLNADTTTAQLAQQAAMGNQAAANAMTQFNVGNNLTAQQLNQSAGLQGSQQRLNASNQLANIGNLGFGMGQEIQAGMARDGALQQATQQAIIDQAKNQYAAYTGMPASTIGYLSQALGATTVPQSQETTKQLGLMDYLSAGASIASMSDRRLKKNIESIGELNNGVKIYKWDWNEVGEEVGMVGSGIGVIAQEVAETMPEAVLEADNGYLMVDYRKVLEAA